MRNKIDLYSRISVAVVLAFLTSQLLVQEVFLAQSPQVRPDLADRVVETSLALINVDNYVAFFQGRQEHQADPNSPSSIQQNLADAPLLPTAIQGVYAKETDNAIRIEEYYDEVNWIEVDYQKKDGSIIKIEIPAGTTPPPPGLF